MNGERFDAVFGPARGGRQGAADAPRSSVELARELVDAVESAAGSIVDVALLERRLAGELGLELRPGNWVDGESGLGWVLTAVYHHDRLVGLWGVYDGACHLLRLDRPPTSAP